MDENYTTDEHHGTPIHTPKSGYWILFHRSECVICGCGDEYRERIYDRPKPENPNDRYKFEQFACGQHFI